MVFFNLFGIESKIKVKYQNKLNKLNKL
jgi:hypothetical protein